MKKILAFAGSNSKTSINKQLAIHAATIVETAIFDVVDLNDYPLPIFSIEEEEKGFPKAALEFNEMLTKYDGFVVSLAEHNGSYSAVFKNIFDWTSRIDRVVFKNKPLLLLATSPGARGGMSVLETAKNTFPRMGAKNVTTFSLPNFYENFKDGKVVNQDLKENLSRAVQEFQLVI